MAVLLVTLFTVLVTFLVASNYLYYVLMKRASRRPWSICIDTEYTPKVTMILPTYNEAPTIAMKLDNIQQTEYPEGKLDVIIVDSASPDETADKCESYIANAKARFPMILISEEKRMGKSHALNTALKYASGEIVATTDADSFWLQSLVERSSPMQTRMTTRWERSCIENTTIP